MSPCVRTHLAVEDVRLRVRLDEPVRAPLDRIQRVLQLARALTNTKPQETDQRQASVRRPARRVCGYRQAGRWAPTS